jgi:hypothetical protein
MSPRGYTDAFPCVLWWFPCRYRISLTLYVANNYLQLSDYSYYVPTSNMVYLSFPLPVIRYEYGRPL